MSLSNEWQLQANCTPPSFIHPKLGGYTYLGAFIFTIAVGWVHLYLVLFNQS